ncbi:MAG TPA: hypothetical protein VI997_08690 [Candidatus Thermoplasmatota archaeon]|nr:hypothetical protein [Candidatus Thermoplasmatota archaeon]
MAKSSPIQGPVPGARIDRDAPVLVPSGDLPPRTIPTGSLALDAALGGGLPIGVAVLVEAEEGAGSTEFALSVLRAVVRARGGHHVRFLSALRSPARVEAEARELFADARDAQAIDIRAIRPDQAAADCLAALEDLGPGDVLVIESASALARFEAGKDLAMLMQNLGNIASETASLVLLLHAPGTLPPQVECSLAEAADGFLSFRWRDGGPTRRRILMIKKLRGLAPVLDGEQIPVFEVSLHKGVGFAMSKVRNLV